MKYLFILLALISLGGLQACAHADLDQQLDSKVEKEGAIKNRETLRQELDRLIQKLPQLSQEERNKLNELRDKNRAQAEVLRESSFKLRAVLIKDLVSPDYDVKEVARIKERIKENEHKRVSLFFSTVRSMNEILGRWASRTQRENQDFYNQMMQNAIDLSYPY